jgi:hypothetical protein
MKFEPRGEITAAETIATGSGIRDIARYGNVMVEGVGASASARAFQKYNFQTAQLP